jgi:3-hydroxyisobutyrate dehydrogenase-like beta-hydroxyacid dehydrogenase
MNRICFVGVGRLGGQLAGSLLRNGYAVSIHDLERAAARRLEEAGADWADSPAAAARGVDVAVTCLPSPGAVAAAVEGKDGILASLAPGATWIDTSTNDRRELLRLAAIASGLGVNTLEAPVTGGVHLAATGDITMFVGGDEGVADVRRPLLEAMCGRIFHVGPLGSATDLKLITNMLAFVHLVACGEALMLAKRADIDLALAFDAIRASSGNSFVHETESQVILSGSYDIGFTLDLALKDLSLALELADERGVPLELVRHVRERFVEAQARYGGNAWSPTVVKLLEDELGVELRAPGFPAALV